MKLAEFLIKLNKKLDLIKDVDEDRRQHSDWEGGGGSQTHSTVPTGVLIVINILGPYIFTHTPHPHLSPQEHLTSSDCIHVPATPPSVLSLCLSLFSYAAGGWLP